MRKLWVVGAMLLIAGCQTKTVSEMNFTEREQLGEQIKQRCVAQGTVPGTGRYGECLKAEAQREVATRHRRAAVQDAYRAQNNSVYCQSFGSSVTCF